MLVIAVILPFWTAFLIRIYAWITILQRDGLLNDVLLALGIIEEPAIWLATDTAIYHRHRLFLSAVHGAAALRGLREDGRHACSKPPPISAARAGRRSGW